MTCWPTTVPFSRTTPGELQCQYADRHARRVLGGPVPPLLLPVSAWGRRVPLRTGPGEPASTVVQDGAGTVLARVRLRDDGGKRVASGCVPLSHDLGAVVRHLCRDLAGSRLETPHEELLAALLADGLPLRRASTTLTHDLADLPEPAWLPDGWTWRVPGWDDDLAEALEAAYGPEHPDGGWQPDDTAAVRGMLEQDDPFPPLPGATARVAGPDGRSAGHVARLTRQRDRRHGARRRTAGWGVPAGARSQPVRGRRPWHTRGQSSPPSTGSRADASGQRQVRP